MVLDDVEFESYVKAGRIASEALRFGASLVKEGASLLEVAEKVEEKIISLGGSFAFPPQISLNDVAAHYCPTLDDKTVFRDGDVVKLDFGVHINGFVADNALTIVLGEDLERKRLAEASRAGLDAALKIIRPGVKLREVGRVIEVEIKKRGFNPIINLSGHGLGRFIIHQAPTVPNFEIPGDETLKEDQVIAIEPFATSGAGMIYESSNATIYSLSGSKPVRSPLTREVLKTIHDFNSLPFTHRWLVKKHGLGKTAFALRELKALGILSEYPPLPDKAHGLVSQAEHTVIVRDPPIVTTKWV
jgi:methionyl aminopeptidase